MQPCALNSPFFPTPALQTLRRRAVSYYGCKRAGKLNIWISPQTLIELLETVYLDRRLHDREIGTYWKMK